MKKVLFTATVDSHILHFHIPYLKMFKEKGYEVHVATNGTEEIPYCDVKHVVSFERSPIKINNLKAIKQLKKIIDKESFEIIHCHTPMGSVVTRLAAKKARKKGTRVIYTAHGFHFFKGAPILNWVIFYPIEKYLAKYTDCLITINQEDYDLAKRKFKAKQIELVHGVGVDESKFNFEIPKEEKHELRKSLGLKDDDFVLIQVGELNKNKNQIMSINAMKDLIKENPKIHLLLVGKGELEEFYTKKIEEYKLQNNVHLLGYRTDVAKLMKISNVLLSLSYREGIPVNVIEGMIVGLPIIATDCRGNRDLLDNCIKLQNIKILKVRILKEYNLEKTSNKYTVLKYLNDAVRDDIRKIYFPGINTEPIRILHIIRAMDMGGAENFIMNLYRKVDKKKIQFDFITSKEGFFDNEIIKMGGKIYRIPYLTEKGPVIYVKNLKKIFQEHNEYNIVHSHIDQVSGIILETAKKCKVRVRIAHSHSTANNNGIVGKIYKQYLQNKINKNATDLFACSDNAARWLYKERANEAVIINNGIDIEKFKFSIEKREEIKKELSISEDNIILGHVGAFRKEKNHKFLIELFSEFVKIKPKAYLILIGSGPMKREIEYEIEKHNIKDKVMLLGVKNNVNEYYNIFDVFVFPSIYEGIPLTLIEAMSNGLNILASENITKKINISNMIKYIDLNKKEEWIYALNNINKENFRNNKDIRLEDYDIDKIANKYTKFIKEKYND